MMQELVSVVVATYRRESELARALESLRTQTYENYEIILVDDNDDPSWNGKVEAIVAAFRANAPRRSVKYIQNHPNLGSAKARNVGIEAADGVYVSFLDDDDLYLPDKIEHQLSAMAESSADYSVTDLALYNEADKLIEIRRREYIVDTSPESLLKYHLLYHITGTDTMMFKRDYLLKIGCFSPIDVGDEFYLMQKAIEGEGNFLYVPVCDVKAYVHTGEGGLSSGDGKISGENQLFAYKKQYFDRFDKKSVRYIKMRHYAVLAFAYLRMKKLGSFLGAAMRSFFSSPSGCMKLFLNSG